MGNQGPALQAGEVEGVIAFVIERAKQLQTRELTGRLSIPLEELKPLLTGAIDEGHYVNRIRWKMKTQFKNAGIVQTCKGNAYEFTLDKSIDIARQDERKERRAAVDTFSNFDEPFIAPPWYSDLLDALEAGSGFIPFIQGPQGCGKSRTCEEAMAKLGRKCVRIALGEYRDPVDLIGTKEIVEENGVPVTKLVGGVLTEAIQKGWGIVLDEYDMMPPQMLSALNRIIEPGSKILLQTEQGIVEIDRHPDTLIAVTANTWGYGDDAGEFAGVQIQNRASYDRLHPKMSHDYDYNIEQRLMARYLPKNVIEALYKDDTNHNSMGIVRLIRKAILDKNNSLEDTMGLRTILFFAKSWKLFGWSKGMHYFLNDFRPENRDAVAKIITTRLGMKYAPSRNDYDKNAPNYIPEMMKELIDKGFGH